MANQVAVLGSGIVGEVLANGFLRHGYSVMRGTREPAKLAGWKEQAGGKAEVGDFATAAAWGDVVVL
jgi:8-hydroxy-5-deazaflavin:NADPH oxidoreductase